MQDDAPHRIDVTSIKMKDMAGHFFQAVGPSTDYELTLPGRHL